MTQAAAKRADNRRAPRKVGAAPKKGKGLKDGSGSKGGSNSKDPTIDNSEEQYTAPKYQNWWLGFDTMEKKTLADKIPECFIPEPISKLTKKGFSEIEAEELLKSVHSYPHVPQILYPTARPDGLDSQHYNLTQLPFDIATHP